MKKILYLVFILTLLSNSSFAQKKNKDAKIEPYKFETIIENPITSVKNQASSGTCWFPLSISDYPIPIFFIVLNSTMLP